MSLTTVIASKSGPYKPLLTYVFTWGGTVVLRLASIPLSAAEGGFQLSGNDYESRILESDIGVIQAQGPLGFDVAPELSLNIADPDAYLQTNFEVPYGFAGATVDVQLFLADVTATGINFSTDSQGRFTGICDGPKVTAAGVMTIRATNRLNMGRKSLPDIPIQNRDPWIFPTNATQRASALSDKYSNWYQCGYSPDISGGFGDFQSGTTPYTSCNYTKSDCIARGMYKRDHLNQITGTFGGSQWIPSRIYWKGKNYTSGNTADGYDFLNQARYGEFYPDLIGTQLMPDCPTMGTLGDPNSTRFEVVAGFGKIDLSSYAARVIVNGVVVARGGGDVLFTRRKVNDGSRNGQAGGDALYDGNGDPYGSLTCEEVVVPVSLQQSGSAPSVAIRGTRMDIPAPNTANAADANSWPVGPDTSDGLAYLTSTAILYVLIQSGAWTFDRIDLQSFIDAATVCGQTVTYTDLTGYSGATHEMYRCSTYFRQKRTIPEILTGLKNNCNALVAPNTFTGLLEIRIEQTLGEQQSVSVAGSNNASPVTSVTALGTSQNGYSAYDFSETDGILKGTFSYEVSPLISTGNTISTNFQDKDNQYQQDSLSQSDPNAVDAAGGRQIDSTFQLDGLDNYDQASRQINLQFFRSLYGNPSGSGSGSYTFTFTSTKRVTHLRIGDICRLSRAKMSLVNQTIRIRSIKPTNDYNQLQITASWHEDSWYVLANLQSPAALYSNPGREVPARDPYPWKPGASNVYLGDPLMHGDASFVLVVDYATDAAGNPIPVLDIQGFEPANVLSKTAFPPLVGIQGSTSNTGGTFPPGTYIGAVATIGADARVSTISHIFTVLVPTGTSTNTITTPQIHWQAGSVGYVLYLGAGEISMTGAALGPSTTPSSITVTDPIGLNLGPPDVKFDHFRVQAKRIIHAGLWAIPITGKSGAVLTFAGQSFTVNQYAGHVISLLAAPGNDPGNPQTMQSFTVVSNTATTVTVDLSTAASVLPTGALMVMRAKADGSSTTSVIVDPLWVNSVYPGGLSTSNAGYVLFVAYGTGRGQVRTIISSTTTSFTLSQALDVALDSTSVYIIVEPTWQYDFVTSPLSNFAFIGLFPKSIAQIPLSNLADQSYLIRVLTEDSSGHSGAEYLAPFRETYIYGQASIGLPNFTISGGSDS